MDINGTGITLIGEAANAYVEFLYVEMWVMSGCMLGCVLGLCGLIAYMFKKFNY